MQRIIFHVDQNCYFASVEMIAHPECRDVPMAVAGDVEARHGIILAKNELAKKAGVKTIIMSLWDVDDKVAKEFSVRFYEELTKNGWDKRKAFEKAKSRIRKMKDYKEPFYWAGFVMLD